MKSSFNKFFHDLVGIDAFLRFWFKLFDKLVGLLFSPLVAHRHQKLLQKIAFQKPTLLIFFLVAGNNSKGFLELLFDVVLPHPLQNN
jgi:hypothetical protein